MGDGRLLFSLCESLGSKITIMHSPVPQACFFPENPYLADGIHRYNDLLRVVTTTATKNTSCTRPGHPGLNMSTSISVNCARGDVGREIGVGKSFIGVFFDLILNGACYGRGGDRQKLGLYFRTSVVQHTKASVHLHMPSLLGRVRDWP